VSEASLNQALWHWNCCKKLPAKNKSRSFAFKCLHFSGWFWFWEIPGGFPRERSGWVWWCWRNVGFQRLWQSSVCLLMVVSCLPKHTVI